MTAGRRVAFAAVLCGLTVLVYARVLRGEWLWDDGLEIYQNALLRDPAGWWKVWAAPAGLDYLPLKSMVQWAEWHLWHDSVLGYHLVNVALQVVNALLLWRLVARLGCRWAPVAAFIFALHPLAVESVAWIAEFKNGISLLPLLLSALCAVTWHRSGRGDRRAYAGMVIWFAVSLTCKPSGILFPLALLVAGFSIGAIAPLVAASALMGGATLYFQWHRAMGDTGLEPTPHGAAVAAVNVLHYAAAMVFPTGLSPVYAPDHRQPAATWLWIVYGGVGAVLLGWRCRKAWLAYAWFFLALVPILGFVPMAYLNVAPRADHLAYVALAVAAGAAAFGAQWLAGRSSVSVTLALTALASAFCALTSGAYAAVYRSPSTLWATAVRRQPAAWLARVNWGRELLRQGNTAAAIAELRAGIQLNGRSAEAHADLGNALNAAGDPTAALAEYRLAVEVAPNFAGGHYDLGRALLLRGANAPAAEQFRAALALDSRYVSARNNLGLALMRSGDLQGAEAAYRGALALQPDLPEAHLNLGNLYFTRGEMEQAAAEYRTALGIRPDYGPAHLALARALIALGQMPAAREELRWSGRR